MAGEQNLSVVAPFIVQKDTTLTFFSRTLPAVVAGLFLALPAPAQENAQPPAPAPLPAGDMALPAKGTYRITGDAKALSVFAVSVDASELFTAIASKAGLPVVVDSEVSRKITIHLQNRPAKLVLTDICAAYGLSVADVDGITMISVGTTCTSSTRAAGTIIIPEVRARRCSSAS